MSVANSSQCYRFIFWQLLGRSIDLAFLIGQRMNKIFRENLDFLFERFEAHDLCTIVVLDFDLIRLIVFMSLCNCSFF
jgi:hypothetical protein